MLRLGAVDLADFLHSPFAADRAGDDSGPAVLVDAISSRFAGLGPLDADLAGSLPVVIVAVVRNPEAVAPELAAVVDVVVGDGDPSLHDVLATVTAQPRASVALALLLRGAGERSIGHGLAAESAVYSTLQSGPEFGAWRADRPVRDRPVDEGPPVRCWREGSTLHIALSRPDVHNAFDARMRDALVDALAAGTASGVDTIELTGDGPSFCSGGDLDEFGSFPDPATAHLVRLHRSAARAVAAVADRVVARLHGACIGSGIELPAFAAKVVASPDTVIALPELSFGLVPGAGGTVSLPRRIGRHRTAWLALSGARLDAETARAWGLVDAVDA
jgi:hypothetical protein